MITILLLVVIVILLAWIFFKSADAPPPAEPPLPHEHTHHHDHHPEPPRAVPDHIPAAALPQLLSPTFAGAPLDGAVPADTKAVVWAEDGDEVIVHLDSLQTHVEDGIVLVAIDLETDQTGRSTVVVPFAVSTEADGSLVLATEDRPRGRDDLVDRWGESVREAAYAALLELLHTHADERGQLPGSLWTEGGALRLRAEAR